MTIYGNPGKEAGDVFVYEALKSLSKDWLVYAQTKYATASGDRNPDYVVIHPELGVIILEVKDWTRVIEHTMTKAKVQRTNGETVWETSPVEQARIASQKLANKLAQDPLLSNLRGKLDFPYRYAGILPHFSNQMLYGIRQRWGTNQVFGFYDLHREQIEQTLLSIPAPFSNPMTPDQVDAVRAIVDPDIVIKETHGQDIWIKGIIDRIQEELIKEPLEKTRSEEKKNNSTQLVFLENGPDPSARELYLGNELPKEVLEAKSDSHIRLIRGFAGTGKTDVLILRAQYLIKNYPDLKILVTTFNRPVFEKRIQPELKLLAPEVETYLFFTICRNIFIARFDTYQPPSSTEGILKKMIESGGEIGEIINEFGVGFLTNEIEYMKELDLTTEDIYLRASREGRGGRLGQSLSRQKRTKIFKVFIAYNKLLSDMVVLDYPDLYHKALDFIKADDRLHKKYDVVLIDEAQHFAPKWIDLLLHLVKPDGDIMLCDDPSQSVFRAFSWKQKGVGVVGRTRWLRIPYRCTKTIFEAAYALIESNPIAKQLIIESGDQIAPDLENYKLREGRRPEVHKFTTWVQEKQFIRNRIKGLIYEGYLPSEIVILHTKKYVLVEFSDLRNIGIITDELRRETGMEYKVVFLPKTNDLFDIEVGDSYEEWLAQKQVTYYMAMTRARDHVFLLMETKWPSELAPIASKVDIVDHCVQETSPLQKETTE